MGEEKHSDLSNVEVADPEVIDSTGASGLVKVSEDGVVGQLQLAENIEKLVEAQNKIRVALLRLAQPGDWVVFNDAASIGFAGAMRVGSTLGVSFTDFSAVKESGVDELGAWFRWEVECTVRHANREVRVYGRAGSRDAFFGKANKEWKPLHNVNEGNIKMAARRAAMKEGVKVLFGLHAMSPEYLEAHGITLEKAGGHDFESREKLDSSTQVCFGVLITEVTQKVAEKWTKYTITADNKMTFSTFDKKHAETAKLAKESAGKVDITYKDSKYGHDLVGIGMVLK